MGNEKDERVVKELWKVVARSRYGASCNVAVTVVA
jgi:hypothetical protein